MPASDGWTISGEIQTDGLDNQIMEERKMWSKMVAIVDTRTLVYKPQDVEKVRNIMRLHTREKTASTLFCDSPYHLSTSVDTCRLTNRAPGGHVQNANIIHNKKSSAVYNRQSYLDHCRTQSYYNLRKR